MSNGSAHLARPCPRLVVPLVLAALASAALAPSSRVQADPPAGDYQLIFSGAATTSTLPETFEAVETTDGAVYEYTFYPIVDLKGRITGEVHVRVEGTLEKGGFSIVLTCPLSGSIKGRTGDGRLPSSRLKLGFKLDDTVELGGVERRVALRGSFKGELLHAATSHTLTGSRSFKADGLRTVKARSALDLESTPGDGDWSLALTLEADGASVGGSAFLGHRGRVIEELAVRGKYSDKKDASTLSLKPVSNEKGSSLKIKDLQLPLGDAPIFDVKYQLLGHKGKAGSDGGNAELFPARSEGTLAEPLDITALLPYRGQSQASVRSYYVVRDLIDGGKYRIAIEDFVGEAARIELYLDADLDDRSCLTETRTGLQPCDVQADAGGEIYLVVDTGPFAAAYTIALELVEQPGGGFVDEGSRESPVDITGALPHEGTVWRGRSFYRVDGLRPGSVSTITLSDITVADAPGEFQGLLLTLWGEGLEYGQADCSNGNSDPLEATSTVDCAARADDDGALVIEVGGLATVDGASFRISSAPGGLANEGYDAAHLDISRSLPWSGTVHYKGASLYVVNGLSAGASTTVTVKHSQEVRLHVWALDPRGNRAEELCRTTYDPDTTVERCIVSPPTASIAIWVATYNDTAPPGATFELNVIQAR